MYATIRLRSSLPLAITSFPLLFILFLTGDAFPSMGVISLQELTQRAEVIVHGNIKSVKTEEKIVESKSEPGKILLSVSTAAIELDKILKGRPEMVPLQVKAIGNMEDSPKFKVDEEVFLFLVKNEDDSTYSTVGLVQGKFNVSGGLVVREKISTDQFIQKIENLINPY